MWRGGGQVEEHVERGDQWNRKRGSMESKEGINGIGRGDQWNRKRGSMESKEGINGIERGDQWNRKRGSMESKEGRFERKTRQVRGTRRRGGQVGNVKKQGEESLGFRV
jgi:hypothetical protein